MEKVIYVNKLIRKRKGKERKNTKEREKEKLGRKREDR